MKLVPNWKKIVLRSHSMWAVYLGILLLVVPEFAYGFFGYQVLNPLVVGWGGLALLVYGALGRIKAQGIDHD